MEEYSKLYTRLMEKINIEPEEKQEKSDSFRSDEEQMIEEP